MTAFQSPLYVSELDIFEEASGIVAAEIMARFSRRPDFVHALPLACRVSLEWLDAQNEAEQTPEKLDAYLNHYLTATGAILPPEMCHYYRLSTHYRAAMRHLCFARLVNRETYANY